MDTNNVRIKKTKSDATFLIVIAYYHYYTINYHIKNQIL